MAFTQTDIQILSSILHQEEPSRPNLGDRENMSAETGAHGDHDLNPGTDPIWDQFATKHAAVLVAITDEEIPKVILTERAKTLSKHAGEVAFPGGRRDDGENAWQTAIREASEEIALSSTDVTFLGYLDPYYTISQYRVIPVVVTIPPHIMPQFKANEQEVDDIFSVPIEFFMNLDNHQTHSVIWQGLKRHYYAMPWQERYIWGATAGMLRNMVIKWVEHTP